jgi:MFS family permease
MAIDAPVLRNGPFVRLWTAQALTQTAQNAIWYALLVIVEERTHSTTQLGFTILSVILPSVLFGIPAGVYVDRWDKRTVLVATNMARAVIVLGYIVFGQTMALLFAVSFIFSVVSQFFAPAETAMIPVIVDRKRLMQANSMFHLTFTASQLVGLVMVGPLIVKMFGTTTFFAITAILFAVSGLLVFRLPADPARVETRTDTRSPVGELLDQLREVLGLLARDRVMLLSLVYLTLGGTMTLVVAMLAPRFAVDVLGIAAADAVFVMAPAGVGILIAVVVLSRQPPGTLADRQRLVTMGLAVVSVALGCVAGLPAIGRFFGVLRAEGEALDVLTGWDTLLVGGVMLSALIAGFGFAAVLVASQTLLQERAPVSARGRVFAVQFSLANLFSVIPLLSIGGLADVVGVGRVLLVIAVVLMIIAVWTSRVHFEAKDGEASQSGGNEGEITGETVIPSVGGLTPGPTVPGVPAAIDGESKGSI